MDFPLNYPTDWTRGLVYNSTCDTFPTVVSTTTEPAKIDTADTLTTNQIVFPGTIGRLMLRFFGTGADNGVFSARLYGWAPDSGSSSALVVWHPALLVEFAVALSTLVGVANGTQIATERHADTVTATDKLLTTAASDFTLYSPAGNIAHAVAIIEKTLQFKKYSIVFDVTSTAANAAYRWVN